MNQINMILDGEESEISENDIVQRKSRPVPAQDKHHDARPIIYPSRAEGLFRRTKKAFDTFQCTLYAEYVEWADSSEAEREDIRNRYCAKYADFNAYHAMNYLISFLKDDIISAECETALVNTIVREHQEAVYEKRLSRKPVANRPDKQNDAYQDDGRITSLLKAYLALNKQQFKSLKQCSIVEFRIRKKINHRFLTYLKLRPLLNQLNDLYREAGQNSMDLDRQLWSDISALDYQLEHDSEITRIKSQMSKWTYADILLQGQKILPNYILRHSLDLTKLPIDKQFVVTIEDTFDPEHNYDYQDVYTRFRYSWSKYER
jgi:hypothetical protein